jgi:hypothetical protein
MRRDHRSREIRPDFLGERRASVRDDVRKVPQDALTGDALRQRPRYPCVKRAMSNSAIVSMATIPLRKSAPRLGAVQGHLSAIPARADGLELPV